MHGCGTPLGIIKNGVALGHERCHTVGMGDTAAFTSDRESFAESIAILVDLQLMAEIQTALHETERVTIREVRGDLRPRMH